MSPEAFRLVADQAVAKGDVLAVSEVAGTLAAKRTAELIPLCHPLGLDHVEVEATLDEALPGVRVRADRKSTRLNSSHLVISYAVFCLKKKKKKSDETRESQGAQAPSLTTD